jgi:hypothetical protein
VVGADSQTVDPSQAAGGRDGPREGAKDERDDRDTPQGQYIQPDIMCASLTARLS